MIFMKILKDKRGFALVETIICALFVASIFTLLFTQMYPITGSTEATYNYDDIGTKYIAHYLREIITTDRKWLEKRFRSTSNSEKLSLFDLLYNSTKDGTALKSDYLLDNNNPDTFISAFCGGSILVDSNNTLSDKTTISLSLSNENTIDPTTGENVYNGKNNEYYCEKYIKEANINRVFFYPYHITKKSGGGWTNKDSDSSFAAYLSQLPTHQYSTKKSSTNPRYMWMIVEVRHENKDTDKSGEYYYSYASIEVHD